MGCSSAASMKSGQNSTTEKSGDNRMTQEPWHLTGEYFEACNCDLICPCLVQAPPSRGRCDAALAFHVADGTYGQTVLNDRTTVLVVSFPGPGKMRDGDWTAAL